MKRSLVVCVLAVLVLLAALIGYLLWYGSISTLSTTAENLGNQVAIRNRTQARIATTDAALADLSDAEANVGAYFVAPENVVPFIENLQSLGSAAGASVNVLSVSATPGATGANPQLPTINIALSVSGTFDHVVRAIGAIENAPYDLTLSSVSLAASAKGGWSANLALVVGSASDAAQAPAAPAAGAAGANPLATTTPALGPTTP